MTNTLFFDPLHGRKGGPHDFDSPPVAGVAAHVLRPSRDVRMTELSVHDPAGRITEAQRTQLGDSLRPHTEVAVLRLRNARVSGTGLVLTEDGHLLRESNLRPPHITAMSDTGATLLEPPAEPEMRLEKTPVVALNGVWPVHYGHWTYDNFARLGLAQEALGSRRYSVLTGYKFRGQQWCRHETAQGRMLGLAGIPMKKVHRLADHEWAQVADLVVISPLNNFRPPAHEIFAQEEMFRFLARIGEKSRASGKGKRIYCSRRDTTNRMMENEAELIEAVAKQFGFVEVQLGEHSVDEQIAIFREAEIAIGPIGNAFMNMAYMGPDARIVTFLPPETWHFLPYYQSFATAGGFDVHAVIGETSHSEGADLNALRWRVDIDAACKNVDAIIQQGDQRQSLLERLMTWMTRRATSNTKDNT